MNSHAGPNASETGPRLASRRDRPCAL